MHSAPAYQVVARRYRPQRFADLVGQEHVARGLSGAIESGRVGHAYLFTGARGVGKTSAARIFAKALQCANGPAPEPCNECDACRDIAAGQDVDVVEIDAASNRGVDEIRQLRQNVAVRPARGRCKVYIIDEVHMLTREAFNALLKTLEEPPGHVKFVLCTTEPDKLPITILSRCQRFDFTIVAPGPIARRLAQIVEAEGADVAPAALDLIARRAAGSMRDSQSLLEQLLGSAAGHVGVDQVHALIGTGREERVGEMLAACAARDAAAALAAFDAALQGGADPGGVLDQLVAALRDCLLASVGCGADVLTQPAGLGVDLAGLGRQLGTATILAMLQILDHTLSRMAVSSHADVLAEMALVRLAKLEDLDSLAAALDGLPASPAEAVPTPPREKKTPDLTAPGQSSPAREVRNREIPPGESRGAGAPVSASNPEAPSPAMRPASSGGRGTTDNAPVEPRAVEPRVVPARSQAALLRETANHPLVAHARTLFDASIRRVEKRSPTAAAVADESASPARPAQDRSESDDPEHHEAEPSGDE
jgi:DNA polymerase-3 subunit gamma/tau